ncbi:MAG: helicase associated domain-containing protein [Prosthecobacter sp.]|uniref:helicase associated domain-containing protein n=1 Tax=Prosthecobacter sp. TaxID=1965333 RepID=UPI00390282B0
MRRPAANPHLNALAEHTEWEWHFAQLAEFIHSHGHADLGTHPVTDWLQRQRHATHLKQLSPDRQQRLRDLGIDLDQDVTLHAEEPEADELPLKAPAQNLIALWETRYAELCAYQAEHGHTNVTKSQNRTLGHWRDVQRDFRRKGMLKPDRIARLDTIGFEWEAPGREDRTRDEWHQYLWDEHFQRLVTFKERFGHAHVPVQWSEDRQLGEWVAFQRDQSRRQRLPADRYQRLDALGFVWKPAPRFNQPPFPAEHAPDQKKIALWETRYAELCAYQAEHGHTNVTKGQNRVLGHWRDVQREFRRKGMLKPDRIARLDAIGFEWKSPGREDCSREEWNQHLWGENFVRLSAFKDRFGHAQVPQRWPEDTTLATWVADQRKAGAKGRLPADRRQRLDALGFDWKPATRPMRADRGKPRPSVTKQARWEQRYAELSAFKQQHGHTRVPNKRPAVAQLCNWCYSQRAFRRQGVLSADRITRLDALGFDWDNPSSPGKTYRQHLADAWDAQYARLTAFHQRFGHSRVPVSWTEDKPLVTWVEKQRKAARKGRLSTAHRARLDALSFVWKPDNSPVFSPRPDQHGPKPAHDVTWLRHLDSLRALHQQHGHLHPSKTRDPGLWNWCAAQRKARRTGTLTLARQAQLEAIGFA